MAFPNGLVCHYCGKSATTWDHIVPRSKRGPRRARWNLIPACRPCNEAKRDNDPTCKCIKCLLAVYRVQSGYRTPQALLDRSPTPRNDLWSSSGFQAWYAQFQPRGYRG